MFPKRLGIFSLNFARLLYVPIYANQQIFRPGDGPPSATLLFFFFSSSSACYQIFQSIRICRFLTHRYETFHTYYRQYSASGHRGGILI